VPSGEQTPRRRSRRRVTMVTDVRAVVADS
jgi:hypothetical protein